MTVAGNFTQMQGGTYMTEVAGAGLSDRINVGGTATLGGQVIVTALPGMTFAPSTTYTILNAAGGLSGTFASVNELYPFLQSNLSYDANNAYLNLAIGGFAAAAATPTQAAVGNVLDANVNNATGDFATVLGAMAFNTLQQHSGPGDAAGDPRQQLRRLLDLDGPGRPALHEQLRQPDRRRRLTGQQSRRPGRSLRCRLRQHHAAQVGRLGRCARRPRHHRRQPAGRLRHLQCRRLRRRPGSV